MSARGLVAGVLELWMAVRLLRQYSDCVLVGIRGVLHKGVSLYLIGSGVEKGAASEPP